MHPCIFLRIGKPLGFLQCSRKRDRWIFVDLDVRALMHACMDCNSILHFLNRIECITLKKLEKNNNTQHHM